MTAEARRAQHLKKLGKRYITAITEAEETRTLLDAEVKAAVAAGVTKMAVHRVSGLSRPTIDKILSD